MFKLNNFSLISQTYLASIIVSQSKDKTKLGFVMPEFWKFFSINFNILLLSINFEYKIEFKYL